MCLKVVVNEGKEEDEGEGKGDGEDEEVEDEDEPVRLSGLSVKMKGKSPAQSGRLAKSLLSSSKYLHLSNVYQK